VAATLMVPSSPMSILVPVPWGAPAAAAAAAVAAVAAVAAAVAAVAAVHRSPVLPGSDASRGSPPPDPPAARQ